MKVAIITIVLGENYGNRLQNYALQSILEKLGCDVETIKQKKKSVSTDLKSYFRMHKSFVKRLINKKADIRKRRTNSFKNFNNKYIKFSNYTFGMNTSPTHLSSAYDWFVVGSDQVWNTHFDDIRNNIKNYLAVFADPGKRIAYAASFGTNSLDKENIHWFKSELPLFSSISVRENSGVELVTLCGAYALRVLDPTLLLSCTDWNNISRKPQIWLSKEFVLVYFLGDLNNQIEKYIETIADGKQIVHLYNSWTAETDVESVEEFSFAPDEFVWLVSHAAFIVTDSFHAAAFSILYHRPFRVFDRWTNDEDNRMGNRIETLLSIFKLQHCKGNLQCNSGFSDNYNWNEVDSILIEERKKSLDFLKNALELDD